MSADVACYECGGQDRCKCEKAPFADLLGQIREQLELLENLKRENKRLAHKNKRMQTCLLKWLGDIPGGVSVAEARKAVGVLYRPTHH